MSDRTLRLLLIDPDVIFRNGLRVVIEQFPDLQVASEAETSTAALQALAELSSKVTAYSSPIPASAVDLVVLELALARSQPSPQLGLQLCRKLKTQYPNLPILLLTSLQEPTQLAAARATGVNGYCLKGISVSNLITAIRQVAGGQSYWSEAEVVGAGLTDNPVKPAPTEVRSQNNKLIYPSKVAKLRNHLRLSGLQQIDATLAEVTAQLQVPGLPLLERAFLAGQRRELLASRWVVNQLLTPPEGRSRRGGFNQDLSGMPDLMTSPVQGSRVGGYPELPPGSNSSPLSPIIRIESSSRLSFRDLQADLFNSTRTKLQFSLQNLTSVPLEIDIFREVKKRELLDLILRKIEDVLDEVRFSQVQLSQLPEIKSVIIRDLWQAATTDFFGRYSTLRVGSRNLEIVNLLLQDAVLVQTVILDKIPSVVDLFSYLLFQTPLVIDNASYAAGSPEAMERAEALLQNLLIQLANGVVQPLLNKIPDVEAIKRDFYDRRLISTREIERFRNNLSWKYRLVSYISEPKAIFESRYDLFVLASRGIAKISIYAPRSHELAQLSGTQLAVTLALETRDAIAPRLRGAVAFLGSGVVYVLTQVIGRAIGLIGRGILQGIGGSLPENKFGRNSQRPK